MKCRQQKKCVLERAEQLLLPTHQSMEGGLGQYTGLQSELSGGICSDLQAGKCFQSLYLCVASVQESLQL